MSVTKVPPHPPAKPAVNATARAEGHLEGMSVSIAPAPENKQSVKDHIASRFFGVKNLFRGLRQRAETVEFDPSGPPLPPPLPLPRLPDGTVNVEAIFDENALVKRLKRIAGCFSSAEEQAVKFLEIAQQLPDLDSTLEVQTFIDAMRSEFTSGSADHWLSNSGREVPDLDACLRSIKEKAQSPDADAEALREEINVLVDPLRAAQIQLVSTTLIPALQAECA